MREYITRVCFAFESNLKSLGRMLQAMRTLQCDLLIWGFPPPGLLGRLRLGPGLGLGGGEIFALARVVHLRAACA